MAAENNLTTNLAKARDIDFVNQFGKGIDQMKEIFGITRMMPVASGTTIKTYKSTVTLTPGNVAEGDIIPLSEVEMTIDDTFELMAGKFRKAVPVEKIQKYGFENAIVETDEKLLRQLRVSVRDSLIDSLANGTNATTGVGLQGALAKTYGQLGVIFGDEMGQAIGFINPLDLADYQEDHTVTLENQMGLQYLKNFLGFGKVIVTPKVTQGKVYGTADQNLVMAYVKIDGEINKAFNFTVDKEVPTLGVLHDINHTRLTAETVVFSGLKIFPEITDGLVVATIEQPSG